MKKALLTILTTLLCSIAANAEIAAFTVYGCSNYLGAASSSEIIMSCDKPTTIDGVATISFEGEELPQISIAGGILSQKAPSTMVITPAEGKAISSFNFKLYRALTEEQQQVFSITPQGTVTFSTLSQPVCIWKANVPCAQPIRVTGADIHIFYVEINYTNAPTLETAEFKFDTTEIKLTNGESCDMPAYTPADIAADNLTYNITPEGIITIEDGKIITHEAGTARVSVVFAGNDKYFPATFEDALTVTVEAAPVDPIDPDDPNQDSVQIVSDTTATAWFDINGRPLATRPLEPGLYICRTNGKALKVFVR